MKQFLVVFAVAAAVVFVGWQMKSTLEEVTLDSRAGTDRSQNLKLISPAFAEGGAIAEKYTCRGINKNPPLKISGVPAKAKFLALEVNDTDAPTGNFVHWVVWNIDPSTREIATGEVLDKAQEGVNSAGKLGYTGPCPSSKHRYFFKLFALDTQIGLDGKAREVDLDKAMAGHIIAQTTLTGIFGK